jgi:hypothetical protein
MACIGRHAIAEIHAMQQISQQNWKSQILSEPFFYVKALAPHRSLCKASKHAP